jgi:single-strand DNA-binding protein
VSFIRTVVWGRMAEICGEYLKKGNPVFVEGRLQSRSWDDKDGQKRNTIEVIAQNVQFLRGGAGAGEGGGGRGSRGEVQEAMGGGKEEMGEIQLEDIPDAGKEEETPF